MSDTTCPFDGDFCQKKQERFDEWKRFVFNPQNAHLTFTTNKDMFSNCPIKHETERKETCERYRRYLFIVKNMKEIEKQYGGK